MIGDAQLLFAQGRYQEAFKVVREAMTRTPNQIDHYLLLGNIFRETGHFPEARDCFGACLELDPGNVSALICLGNLARELRQTAEARVFYEVALQRKPDDPNIESNLANILCDVGETGRSIELLERSLKTNPAPVTHSNLLLTLHYHSAVSAQRIAQEHRAWANRYTRGVSRMTLTPDFSPERRLRLGFVTANFKQHPVGRLLEAFWRCLDRSQFEIFAYDAGTRLDKIHENLRGLAGTWRSIQGVEDEAAAELIRKDKIDVLFDLSGHTGGNRLLVFARKPAPIQATWFAYPDTTGLETVDWRISDAIADPTGESIVDERYVERLLRLPDVAWIYGAYGEDVPIHPRPFTQGQPFTFGCLNKLTKVSDACLAVWARILGRSPHSRLVLLGCNDLDSEDRLRERMGALGANRAQVCFVPQGTPREFYDYHNQVDLMLDPFPYNGAVTTSDALWMGVPVLSVAGNTYVSRQGVCILSCMGLTDWLCADPDEYINRAVALAENPAPLAQLSPTLRERLRCSPLMNHALFTRNLETAIRTAWRQLCEENR